LFSRGIVGFLFDVERKAAHLLQNRKADCWSW